jgi:chaperonin GroES
MSKTVEIRDKRADHSKELPQYEEFSPIMDRILVKRVVLEQAPEGFVVPEKFRQHTNVGIVVKIGQFVFLSGNRIDLKDIVQPGDRVRFGEYNSEKMELDGIEYELVRIQDVRGVERLKRDV